MSENDKNNINVSPVPKFVDNILEKVAGKPSEAIGTTLAQFGLITGLIRRYPLT